MTGWGAGIVLRRLRSQLTVFLVVAAVCLVTATLLTTLAVQVSAVERFGVPAQLAQATAAQTALVVDLSVSNQPPGPARAGLEQGARELFGAVPSRRTSQLVSVPALVDELPSPSGSPLGSVVWFGAYDGVRAHTVLLSGRWPGPAAAGRPVPVAVPEQMALDLGLRPGSRFRAEALAGDTKPTAEVVGVFRTTRPLDRLYWDGDPLAGAGLDPVARIPYNAVLTTTGYGPLLVDPSAFDTGAIALGRLRSRYQPALDRLSAADLDALAARVGQASDTMSTATARVGRRAETRTELGTVLDGVRRLRLITRAAVLVIGSLLLTLAVAALLLVTRLLADRRAGERSLMLARGASRRQLLRLAAAEASVVALAVTLAAPPLARAVYRGLAARPEFARAGLDHDPGLPVLAWLVAAGSGLLFVLVLVTPLLRRPPVFAQQEQARSRPVRRFGWLRSGIDLGVLGLAALAYSQLRGYGSPVTGSGDGLRLDPVLLVGPALALLAGGLLAVRLMPLLAALVERVATAGRRIVLALAAWEVARRPDRAGGAVLLLTLALATGTFGLSYLDTWRASQQDQADFQVGTDARVRFPDTPALAQAAPLTRAGRAASSLVPAIDRDAEIGSSQDQEFMYGDIGGGLPVQLLATDSGRAAGLLRGRVIEPGGEDRPLVRSLGAMRPTSPAGGLQLPGQPAELSLRVQIEPAQPADRAGEVTAAIRLVLQDARGARAVVSLGGFRAGEEPVTATVAVPGALEDGRRSADPARPARLAGPLRLVAVQTDWGGELTQSTDASLGLNSGLVLDQLRVRDAADPPGRWRPAPLPGRVDWNYSGSGAFDRGGSGGTQAPAAGAVLRYGVSFDPMSSLAAGAAEVVYTGWQPDGPLACVITGPLARVLGDSGQDELAVRVGDVGVPLAVLAAVPHLPGTDPQRPAVFLDADALARRLVERGTTDLPLDEWWAAVPDDRAAAFAAAVRSVGGDPVTRVGLGHDLQQLPLRIGIQAALWLTVLGAGLLVAVGFATQTTVALRARRVEFAQLRALGVPRRALTWVVVAESLGLCLLGGLAGIGVGALLGLLVGPLVGMAADGGTPVPEVVVRVPWTQVAWLAVETAALLLVVLAGVTGTNRRRALGAVLRLGEER